MEAGMIKIKDKILTGLLAVAVALLTVTFSIGLPIYFRPFYYMQIEALDIPQRTGLSYGEVKDSYDELLDFLTLPGREFSTGAFPHSESGKSHFEDCKVLFDLNAAVLIISLVAIVLLSVLVRRGVFRLWRPFGLHFSFSSGVYTIGLFAILALLVSANFDLAFEVFHAVLFPGKTNWIFDARTDPIIRAMPQAFFMNCAILIVSSIILISAGLITVSILRKQKKQ